MDSPRQLEKRQLSVEGLIGIFEHKPTKEEADAWIMKMVDVFNERYYDPDPKKILPFTSVETEKRKVRPYLQALTASCFRKTWPSLLLIITKTLF